MTKPKKSDDVYSEGMNARAEGKPIKVCPYPKGTDDRESWLEGWQEADGLEVAAPVKE